MATPVACLGYLDLDGAIFQGIYIHLGDGANTVQGNFIGTDITGNVALGNQDGVFVLVSDANVIGGTSMEARNVISGNEGHGVYSHTATDTIIQGNYIGTDLTGTYPIGNSVGVRIEGCVDNIVGAQPPGHEISSLTVVLSA